MYVTGEGQTNPAGVTDKMQRRMLDLIKELNQKHLGTVGDPEIATRINSFEMAYKMQSSAPELMDVSKESAETLKSYGAESGNMALRAVARSGIYLGGGIAPRILPALRWPEFLDAFRDKENLRPLLESIPVWVIRNELTGLLGAARYAAMEM